jgi:hypothetical protein
MKLFKLFLSFFVLAGLFFGMSLFFPRTYRIERSVHISKPADTVFSFMSDLRNWEKWSAWNKGLDATINIFYGKRSDSTGGRQYFYGEKLGSGRFAIEEVIPATVVRYSLYMHGGEVSAEGLFRMKPSGMETTLSWIDSGDVGYNPIYRYMVPSKVASTTTAFDEGLARIKSELEKN